MTAEDRLRQLLGQLIIDKCMFEAKIAELQAENEKLKAEKPPSE